MAIACQLRTLRLVRVIVAAVAIAALMTAPAAGASGFEDVSFSDAQHGWALVPKPCPRGRCMAVEGTSDGGRSWQRLASLPASAALERIDPTAGVAFGQSAAFVASDGGRRWTRVRGMLLESAQAIADATFALTYGHSGCPGPCDVVLRRAPRGSTAFAALPAFRHSTLGYGDTLVGAGGSLVEVEFGHVAGGAEGAYAHLGISHDKGRTWSFRGDPCRQPGRLEVDSTEVVAAGRYLALLCVVRTTGAGSIALSRDGGRSFERLHPPPNSRDGYASEIAVDAGGDLAILDSVTAGNRISVSYDTGRTWRVAYRRRAPGGGPLASPTLALFGRSLRWVADPQTLLRSDDSGRTWRSNSPP
jgi:photosystem II stability/assembly factor-like uncharacterized protein